ncbi:hypothetical protein Q0812_05330 [Brevundimonas sp. 2R-24]|uniref:DUF4386 family protein n=1 Tax=Peiella sedimenti TaxID=3061083 RepID=A0ABT8SK28_9CAUL|nr:hypothetical protein [Caulobacteraceae bacterium XZ-24]
MAAQLLEWMGLIGSAGGPHSSSSALGLYLLLTPSLLLGPCFVLAVAGLQARRPADPLGAAALAFSAIYAALTGAVYFMQLTLVAPALQQGREASVAWLRFVPFESPLYAVDLLGYGFMSLACLSAGLALGRDRPAALARALLIATGLLLPFITLQMFWPPLIWVAALWGITFPLAMLALAQWARQAIDPIL